MRNRYEARRLHFVNLNGRQGRLGRRPEAGNSVCLLTRSDKNSRTVKYLASVARPPGLGLSAESALIQHVA